jgi:hypothetical protein
MISTVSSIARVRDRVAKMEWASTFQMKVDNAVSVDQSTTAVPPMNCHMKLMDIGQLLAIVGVKAIPLV